MTWEQTLIIAAVPAIVTAASLLLQQWFARRHEKQTAEASRSHEFALTLRAERRELLRRAMSELSTFFASIEGTIGASVRGLAEDDLARWPRRVNVNGDLLARTAMSIIDSGMICALETTAAMRHAREALVDLGAELQRKEATVAEIHAASRAAGARRELQVTPRVPADAAARPPRRGLLARVKDRGQPGSP